MVTDESDGSGNNDSGTNNCIVRKDNTMWKVLLNLHVIVGPSNRQIYLNVTRITDRISENKRQICT